MKNLDHFEKITDDQLLMITGGNWEKICNVGPGEYQYNEDEHEYRWVQTQDNFSYATQVVVNGWASSAGGGYISSNE
jgi:hypothetical protein